MIILLFLHLKNQNDMSFENLVFNLKVEGIAHTNHMINDKPKIGVKLPQST